MAKNNRKSNNTHKELNVNEEILTGAAAPEAAATDTTDTAVTTDAPAGTTDQVTTDTAAQEDTDPLADVGTTSDESTTAQIADTTQVDAPAAAGDGETATSEQLAPPPGEIALEQSSTDTAAPQLTTEQPAATTLTSTTTEAPVPAAAVVADEAPSLLQHLQAINPNITEVPANIKNLTVMLDGYVKAMAPGTPVNAREGVNHQKLLKHILEQAITAPNSQLAIEAVLFYFYQHGGRTFSDRYLGRFVHEMQLTTQQANTFNTLRVVFQTLAEPTGRAARIKLALDISKIAKTIDQKLVRNLLAFMDNVK